MYAKQFERFSQTTIDEEIVLMDLGNGDFFSLTGTAAEIWTLLDDTAGEESIISALSKRHDVESDTIRHDVRQFLDQLIEAGFIAIA